MMLSLVPRFLMVEIAPAQAFKKLRHGKVHAGQQIVKIALPYVVPANAGTHNHRRMSCEGWAATSATTGIGVYGSRRSPGRLVEK
jgi:hypothetical protein